MKPSLWQLFQIFFRVGAFTFGGGYAMVPIIQKELVDRAHLMSNEDFLDTLAVCQSLPGAIAVNVSTYAGYQIAGKKGAAACVLGTVSPSFFAILIIAQFYQQIRNMAFMQQFFLGVRPAIVALLIVSLMKLYPSVPKNPFSYAISAITLILLHLLGLHPIPIIIGCMVSGYISERIKEGKTV
ncbi:chromate transporter [Anoxynatronum buryatiense]|uniref:Chromate transporter n=1 Tax=Anoxynatronum buryatiense TaxID=489973 RepID=A0AA45WX69_9CLOT|nr:chromate transporter [Anoxynatronum buryatiense]SMP61301.1 chromate transporter [Anoxynatronum buryatiense]